MHLGQRNLYQVIVRVCANVCVVHSLRSKKGVDVTAWCVRFPRLCFEVPPAVRRASSTSQPELSYVACLAEELTSITAALG